VSGTPKCDFLAALRLLTRHGVEFIVVGGVGAVLQGAPLTTFDLDVVHSTSAENVERLLAALDELDAVFRAQPERRLRPQSSHLASGGHQLLITNCGPLDVLGSIGRSRTYDDLSRETVPIELGGGLTVRVLSLEALIRVKQETGRQQDLAVLPLLRQTLKQRAG